MQLELFRHFSKKSTVSLKVNGQCMQPALESGATIAVEHRKFYLPGDIVVYARADDVLVSHRVLGYLPGKNGWRLLCRADGGSLADAPAQVNRIVGKAVKVNGEPLIIPGIHRVRSLFIFPVALFTWLQQRFFSNAAKPTIV